MTTGKSDIRQVNLTVKSASKSRFYTEFKGIPENLSNILGRQIVSISRPDLSYEINKTNYKNNHVREQSSYQYTKSVGKFRLDDNGIVLHALMSQFYRQKTLAYDKTKSEYDVGNEWSSKFEIEITTFNANHEINGGFTLYNCLIEKIDFDDSLGFEENTEDIVTVDFNFSGFDFNFVYETEIPV